MKLSRVLIIACALIIAAPAPADAQFSKLKARAEEKFKKGKEKLMEATGVPGLSQENSSSNRDGVGRSVGDRVSDDATSGTSYKKSDVKETSSWRESSAMPAEDDLDTPEGLAAVHAATFGIPFRYLRGAFHQPKETSSTIHLVIDDDMPSFSDFYDGVAYVHYYDGKSVSFYINERGEKLFDSKVHVSDAANMPRFCNGRVLETPDIWENERNVRIRDKRGNTVKEFNTRVASPYFVNGIAAIGIDNGLGSPKSVKFIDTDGNYVLENLTVNIPTAGDVNFDALVSVAVREEKEGLIAFPAWDATARTVLWGFRNAAGNVVIKPRYMAVADFSDGMAKFFADGKWGFIDKTGREAIPASFSIMPSNFNSGFARVLTKNNEAYFIDKNGKKVRGPINVYAKDGNENYISPFFNGYAIVGYGYEGMRDHYCLVDRNFNKKAWFRTDLPLDWDTPVGMHDGKLYIQHGFDTVRNWWMLDPATCDLQIDALYNPFINGYSRYDNKGYVDSNFNYVIKFEKNEF